MKIIQDGCIIYDPSEEPIPYTLIPNELLRDESISPSCRWMLCYLLTNAPGWNIHPIQIWNHARRHRNCGRDQVYKWINEAIQAGYMKRQNIPTGNLLRYRYVVSRTPKFKKSSLHPGLQEAEKQRPAEKDYKKEHTSSYEEVKKEHIQEPPSPKPDKKKSPHSAEAEELCTYFISKIQEKEPEFNAKNRDRWVKELERMLRIDKRSLGKAKEIIDWLSHQPKHFTYIQSGEKLRARFIEQKMHMDTDLKNLRINANRTYSLYIKTQYPKQYQNLSFNRDDVMNLKKGTRLPLDTEEKEFKRLLAQMFGGSHV